jgi:hypothetical protein
MFISLISTLGAACCMLRCLRPGTTYHDPHLCPNISLITHGTSGSCYAQLEAMRLSQLRRANSRGNASRRVTPPLLCVVYSSRSLSQLENIRGVPVVESVNTWCMDTRNEFMADFKFLWGDERLSRSCEPTRLSLRPRTNRTKV